MRSWLRRAVAAAEELTSERWREATAAAARRVASHASEIAAPRLLRETRERPFEVALANELRAVLPHSVTVQTGGAPALPDFPKLGPFDVSVPTSRPADALAVYEFKWWGPPG